MPAFLYFIVYIIYYTSQLKSAAVATLFIKFYATAKYKTLTAAIAIDPMLRSSCLPLTALITTCAIKPKAIPCAILKVNGIIIAANTAGAYSLTSSHSISLRFLRKYVAMNTSAGAVANAGILCANGAKNKHNANNTATVTAVSPVLPPSLIPAPLSI